MSLLSQVTRGKIKKPEFVLIHGPDGVGKNTFVAGAPKTVMIEVEDGSAHLDVERLPRPKTFAEMMALIEALKKEPHGWESLGLDSLDWFEPLVWQQVCDEAKVKQIEDLGYGKGYVNALKLWGQMIDSLKELRRERKMNILVIAHSHVKPYNDPLTNSTYDRYVLKLNDKAAALWREAVDTVLFANFEVGTSDDKKGKTRAYGDGTRWLYTERRPSFDAKNRQGLPFQLALEWDAYKSASDAGGAEDPAKLKASIEALIPQIPQEVQSKVTEALTKAGDDPAKLVVIKNRLATYVAA